MSHFTANFRRFFKYVYVPSALILTVSCGTRKNENIPTTITEQKTLSSKLDKFKKFFGIPTTGMNSDHSSPKHFSNVLSQLPTSIDPTRYLLDPEGEPLMPSDSAPFYLDKINGTIVNSETYQNSPNKNQFVLWTRFSQLTSSIEWEATKKAYTTQCGSIEGIAPFGHDKTGYLTRTGEYKILVPSPEGKKYATGKTYLIKYRLKNAEGDGVSPEDRVALITVPASQNPQENPPALNNIRVGFKNKNGESLFPLVMYAHGGDAGLHYDEIQTLFRTNLSQYIVAAPAFPGEYICGYDTSSYYKTCLNKDNTVDLPVMQSEGERSPIDSDVRDLLGLHDCINHVLAPDGLMPDLPLLTPDYLQKTNQTIPNPIMGKLIPHAEKSKELGYQSIAVGTSRGGAVALLALAMSGLLIKQEKTHPDYFEDIPFRHHFFSSAALFFAPVSLLVGPFQIITQYMTMGSMSNTLKSLPMIKDLYNLFEEFRLAPSDSIAEKNALKKLGIEISKRDIFMTPYITVALQNWHSLAHRKSKNLSGAEPGAIALFHSIEDNVVHYSQSLILYQTFFKLNSLTQDPTHPLNQVPGFNYQLFSFQPTDEHYKIPVGTGSCNQPTFLSQGNKRNMSCFMTVPEKKIYAHFDTAFFDGDLVNVLPRHITDMKDEPILGPNNEINEVFFTRDHSESAPKFTYDEFANNLSQQFEGILNVSPDTVKKGIAYILGEPIVDYHYKNERKMRYSFSHHPSTGVNPHMGRWSWWNSNSKGEEIRGLSPLVMFPLWLNTAAVSTMVLHSQDLKN